MKLKFFQKSKNSLKGLFNSSSGNQNNSNIDHTNNNLNKITLVVSPAPFNVRAAKIAYALEQEGWDVVLLYNKKSGNDYSPYCSKCFGYRNVRHLLRLCAKYKSNIYHCFSIFKMETAEALIKKKLGKVVLDIYDQMSGMLKEDFLKKQYKGQLEREKFCMENADGLCCRNLESQYAKKYLGYKFKGKRLFFLDYCWDTYLDINKSKKRKDGEIHFVYCGNLNVEKYNPNSPFAYHLWLGESLAKQKAHYHLYPHPLYKKNFHKTFSDYIKLQSKTKYFHLHEPCSTIELIREMSQYDFGILILGKQIDGTEENTAYTQIKYDYALGNKIFDFIDAGLPIVMHKEKMSRFLASRYGVFIPASYELITENINSLKAFLTPEMEANFQKAKKAYSLKRNLKRLIKFYSSI